VTLTVGHAFSTADGVPTTVTGVVRLLSDGEYRMRDGGTHGLLIKMGPSAVIAIGSIRLLLRSRPSMEWDTGAYLSQGLDPSQAALVFVKSPSQFRASFGSLAQRILVADTPGPTTPNMRRIPFTKTTRPLFPLDAI
jgi:microcystin degradation protein MlrC